jgi:flavin-dependent dehydrogenase
MANETHYDAVIVGAGVAGTLCALALRKGGYQVLLLDRRSSQQDYKKLCTHFIQPFSVPIFRELGLEALFEPTMSVKTKAAFFVPGGVIDPNGSYGKGDEPLNYAYNLEREVMDPYLRAHAKEEGVDLRMEASVTDIVNDEEISTVSFLESRQQKTITTRLIIAADGRESRLARKLGVETKRHANDRMAFFCYASGIPVPAQQRSLFSLQDKEMSFLYPLINGRTLLSVYIQNDRAQQWALDDSEFASLIQLFKAHLPHIDFSNASAQSPMYGYKRYENQTRPAVTDGVAFIGDAAASVDPMSGVGCGFAAKSAHLLATALKAHGLHDRQSIRSALDQYSNEHKAFFTPHIEGIVADSRLSKNEESMRQTYKVIISDDKLQRSYLDLTGRLITPAKFQRDYLMATVRLQKQQKAEAIEV